MATRLRYFLAGYRAEHRKTDSAIQLITRPRSFRRLGCDTRRLGCRRAFGACAIFLADAAFILPLVLRRRHGVARTAGALQVVATGLV